MRLPPGSIPARTGPTAASCREDGQRDSEARKRYGVLRDSGQGWGEWGLSVGGAVHGEERGSKKRRDKSSQIPES